MRPRISCPVKKLANGTCKSSEVPLVNCVKKVTPTDGGSKTDTGENKPKSTLGPKHVTRGCPLSKPQLSKPNCLTKSSVPNNQIKPGVCNKEIKPVGGCKRKSEEVFERRERKKLKMDAATTLICHNILTDIMDCEQSGPFHTAAKSPTRGLGDYFDLAKKSKDLGTAKQKLLHYKYLFAEEFEADVRRTFTTAMLFNPSGNHYHESAKEFLGMFDRLWEPVKMRKGWEELLLKPSVERQQNDLKTVKDDKPMNKPKPMPRDPVPAKVKCENMPERKIVHVDFNNGVKVNKTSNLQRGSCDQGYESVARIPASGSLDDPVLGGELSQSSASRRARLLDRFSETILKAQNHTLLKQGGGTTAEPLQKETVKLQSRQRETVKLQSRQRETVKLQAAKSVAPSKSESELKKQREAEREASRKALDLMEKSVVVEDNWKVLKDFEALIRQPWVNMCPGDRSSANSAGSRMQHDKPESPLEQLGLCIKEEYKLGYYNDYIISMDGD